MLNFFLHLHGKMMVKSVGDSSWNFQLKICPFFCILQFAKNLKRVFNIVYKMHKKEYKWTSSEYRSLKRVYFT